MTDPSLCDDKQLIFEEGSLGYGRHESGPAKLDDVFGPFEEYTA